MLGFPPQASAARPPGRRGVPPDDARARGQPLRGGAAPHRPHRGRRCAPAPHAPAVDFGHGRDHGGVFPRHVVVRVAAAPDRRCLPHDGTRAGGTAEQERRRPAVALTRASNRYAKGISVPPLRSPNTHAHFIAPEIGLNAFVHARALAAIVVIAIVPAAGDTLPAPGIEPAPRVCHLPLEALAAPSCITERTEPLRGS